MKKLIKIIKIEILVFKLNFHKFLIYRGNMFINTLGGFFYNVGGIMFITFLFDKIPLIGNWDKWDIVLMYGLSQVFAYIYFFITFANFYDFPKMVTKGQLDSILTKPVNSLVFSTTKDMRFNSLFSIIQPLAIVAYALLNKSYNITLLSFLTCIFSLLITSIIVHVLQIFSAIASFYVLDNDLSRTFNETSEIMNYPYEIFTNKYVRLFFFTIVPFGLLINVPFRALVGKLEVKLLILQIVVLICFTIITSYLWKKSLRHYSSASS